MVEFNCDTHIEPRLPGMKGEIQFIRKKRGIKDRVGGILLPFGEIGSLNTGIELGAKSIDVRLDVVFLRSGKLSLASGAHVVKWCRQ